MCEQLPCVFAVRIHGRAPAKCRLGGAGDEVAHVDVDLGRVEGAVPGLERVLHGRLLEGVGDVPFCPLPLLQLVKSAIALQAQGESVEERRQQAHNHYFNLEYEQALVAYYGAMELAGENSSDWNHIATTLLYMELHRLGKLETSAFRGDNEFLIEDKPQPDPKANQRFLGALHQGRKLAEAKLGKSRNDRQALFSLSSNYALEANYQFMIEKSYVTALRSGMKAKKLAEEAIAADPEFVDAYLAPGVQEYVVGSLPWVVKALVAIGGVNGNKKKGVEMVKRVADEGEELRTEARVLMTLLHRREGRPLEAAEILKDLIREFPRNYVLRLELASMLAEADHKDEALAIFERTREMVNRDEHDHARMPTRLKDALERKIEKLKDETTNQAD